MKSLYCIWSQWRQLDVKEKSDVESSRYNFRITMNINASLINEFAWKKTQILVVTKYFDVDTTNTYIKEFQKFRQYIIWFWENRIAQIIEKKLPREDLHFIWNIQSKEIKKIVEYCSYIHSVWNKKHYEYKSNTLQKKKVKIFLQVQLDLDKNIWFQENDIKNLLFEKIEDEYIEIIGISGMWIAEFSREEKIQEFQYLRDIRDKNIPKWKISAGTSRDYKIALEMNIDIIRIWKKLFN